MDESNWLHETPIVPLDQLSQGLVNCLVRIIRHIHDPNGQPLTEGDKNTYYRIIARR